MLYSGLFFLIVLKSLFNGTRKPHWIRLGSVIVLLKTFLEGLQPGLFLALPIWGCISGSDWGKFWGCWSQIGEVLGGSKNIPGYSLVIIQLFQVDDLIIHQACWDEFLSSFRSPDKRKKVITLPLSSFQKS